MFYLRLFICSGWDCPVLNLILWKKLRFEYRSGIHRNSAEIVSGTHRNSAESGGKMSILSSNITGVEVLEIVLKA